MPKLNHVRSARFSKYGRPTCGRCETVIEIGEPYFWWANRIGRTSTKKVRCPEHKPRLSEIQGSPYKAAAYSARESVEDVLASDFEIDELAEALNQAAESVREDCVELLREGAQNIIDGFERETAQSDEMIERADAFDAWADDLESAATDVEAIDWPSVEDYSADEYEELIEQAREEARDIASSAIDGCPE
jgi:hypothetical protein